MHGFKIVYKFLLPFSQKIDAILKAMSESVHFHCISLLYLAIGAQQID